MILLEDIKDLITDNNLHTFFEKRNEDLNILTPEERERQKKFIGENTVTYDDVLIAIQKVIPERNNNITIVLEQYLEKLLNLQAYDNERFYKTGFCDAINFILNAKNDKR